MEPTEYRYCVHAKTSWSSNFINDMWGQCSAGNWELPNRGRGWKVSIGMVGSCVEQQPQQNELRRRELTSAPREWNDRSLERLVQVLKFHCRNNNNNNNSMNGSLLRYKDHRHNNDKDRAAASFDFTEPTTEASDNSLFDHAHTDECEEYNNNKDDTANRGYHYGCCLVALAKRCCHAAAASFSNTDALAQQRPLPSSSKSRPSLPDATEECSDGSSDRVHLLFSDYRNDEYQSLDVSESRCTNIDDESIQKVRSDVRLSEEIPGNAQTNSTKTPQETQKRRNYQLSDFDRHCILGAGQFGQVLLVSEKAATTHVPGEKQTAMPQPAVYALKVHAKYDLLASGEVETILREREMMQRLNEHPFIVRLCASFQDDSFVYLLQEFCQGGELFSVVHNAKIASCPTIKRPFTHCALPMPCSTCTRHRDASSIGI